MLNHISERVYICVDVKFILRTKKIYKTKDGGYVIRNIYGFSPSIYDLL